MVNKLFAISFAASISSCVAIFHWNDWLYVPATIAVLAVLWALYGIVRRLNAVPQRYQRHDCRPSQRSRIFNIAAGVGVGTCVAFASMGVHSLLMEVPSIQEIAWDGDRKHFEEFAFQLEQNGHHSELAELIDGRVHQPISDRWGDLLRRQEYDLWIKAGKQLAGEDSRMVYLKAIKVAENAGFSHDLADELLKSLDDAKRLAELETNRTKNEQVSQRAIAAASASLNSIVAVVFDQFIQWGDSLGNQFALRQSKYEAAINWANQHSLDATPASKRLAALRAEVDALRPAKLPPGSTIQILRENIETRPPVAIFDIAVTDASGQPIRNLASKDFQIRTDGQSFAVPQAALITPAARPIQLIVLVDQSTSTLGPPLDAAKAGVKALLQSVKGNAVVKIFTFGDRVEQLTDWTADTEGVLRSIDSIRANGSTALLQAIDRGVTESEFRPEPRAIAVITDGKDHVGGPAPSELIARCRKASVAIHAVGLKTAELDAALLTELAQSTGGSYQMADRTGDLSKRFESIATLLRRPFYRVVIPDDGTTKRALELQVGLSTPLLKLSPKATE